MKVAIIGAGVAGLSCAYELEKHGIIPTIYEKKRRIGEDVDFVISTLRLFDRMYEDPLIYIKDNYNIELKPLNILSKIIMYAPNKETFITDTSGYTFFRGDCENSLENQLASYVKTSIVFDKYIYIDDIKKDYDYIIDATGKLDVARQLGVLTIQLKAFTRLAVISGNFDVNTIIMWIDTEYIKNGFCSLLAHSPSKACISLNVSDISHSELDYYWEKFIIKENIINTIIKTTDVLHDVGSVFPHKVDNIYFVGKAGGFLGSLLGFGMIHAIETGVLAARSIINNIDYDELIKPIFEYLQNKYEFRKAYNTCDNNVYDKIIELAGYPGIKQLIYNNPLARITQGTIFAKLYNIIHKE